MRGRGLPDGKTAASVRNLYLERDSQVVQQARRNVHFKESGGQTEHRHTAIEAITDGGQIVKAAREPRLLHTQEVAGSNSAAATIRRLFRISAGWKTFEKHIRQSIGASRDTAVAKCRLATSSLISGTSSLFQFSAS
jgi:hypothetical protein